MPVDPTSAIIQTGLGVAQSVVGIVNAAKAKKEAKQLARSRPQYAISPQATDELSMAEGELASGGLSSRAESAYNNLNNQQFASSLSAILKGGGSVNNVGDVFGKNEEGRLRLAQLQDQMRLSKIQNLTSARRYYTDQTDKQFLYNKDAPWKDAAQANAQARQNAENMIWSGVGTAGAAGINYSTQQNSNNQFQQYLKTFGGGGSSTPTIGASPTSFSQMQGGMNPMPNNNNYGMNSWQTPGIHPVDNRNYVQQRPPMDFSYNPQF